MYKNRYKTPIKKIYIQLQFYALAFDQYVSACRYIFLVSKYTNYQSNIIKKLILFSLLLISHKILFIY